MAKKTTKKTARRSSPRISRNKELSSISLQSGEATATDYKEVLRGFISSPAVKYVAGGVATAILARLAANISDRYPEISNFIKENLETVENKLGEFKNEFDSSSARH